MVVRQNKNARPLQERSILCLAYCMQLCEDRDINNRAISDVHATRSSSGLDRVPSLLPPGSLSWLFAVDSPHVVLLRNLVSVVCDLFDATPAYHVVHS